MRAWVAGKKGKEALRERLRKKGFVLDDKEPELLIVLGGDGMILVGAHTYPESMLFPVRKDSYGYKTKADLKDFDRAIDLILKGRFRVREEALIKAESGDKTVYALSEIQLCARPPTYPYHCLRFDVEKDGTTFKKNVISDGIVFATPYGSTGIYSSIVGNEELKKKLFEQGIGVAPILEHSVPRLKPQVVDKGSKFLVRLNRGKAWLVYDNIHDMIPLKEGDAIKVGVSDKSTKFVHI